jgi:hypothetical protein
MAIIVGIVTILALASEAKRPSRMDLGRPP